MPPRPEILRARLGDASLKGGGACVRLRDLASGTALDADLATLDGARVLVRTSDQLFAALALIELDGVAARIVIAPPDLKDEHIPSVIERAGLDTLVTDLPVEIAGLRTVRLSLPVKPLANIPAATRKTEWVMFTSGTTGIPKMVAHSLAALTGAIASTVSADKTVWGTFYDIRRYGGLQILLRALLGKAPLILSDAHEPVADFLARLGRYGVTHLTGTTVALAAGADEPVHRANPSALCAPLRRDRGSGGPRQSEKAIPQCRDGSRLCLHRSGRGL